MADQASYRFSECVTCGRGGEACQWCEKVDLADWEAICDCGLYDFGSHLTDCKGRDEFKYVIAADHQAAEVRR